ncbi:MAG: linear amide C-N hydrolase [Hyphomicrobiales bacterium]
MTHPDTYLNLSVKDIVSEKLGPVTLNAVSSGTGLHGLPGDFTSPSRFVRVAIFGQAAPANATADDAVYSAFHILNQFDIPKGSVINGSVGGAQPEITEWTSVNDLKNLRWYFRTFKDQSIRMVDLNEAIKAAKGEIRTINMESATQSATNVSGEVKSPKQAAN